ncbi:MAG: hypothetical protein KatS3mg081_2198 [Gemmatimonadales bacterium]|nr:MAG: hypothetical protein KatS3mg081_2198 [Gemmatimonadales bacterium]
MAWQLGCGERTDPQGLRSRLAAAALGATEHQWNPPPWLLPHQIGVARRIAGRLKAFRGALLADAPGLGKTYVALAVATRYESATALVPASLREQWYRIARAVEVPLAVISHEAISAGEAIPPAELFIVDEAHRFRNPATRRYDRLARAAVGKHLLLITATFVVNRVNDAVHLLRLFLPDHGLALSGVPSLEQAVENRRYDALGHAIAAVSVARTVRASLKEANKFFPRVKDTPAFRLPPVCPEMLERLACSVAKLSLPALQDRDAAALMRLHLYLRLSSSLPAFIHTVKRHRRYLQRALECARRGEPLSRRAARTLVGEGDELQLELNALLQPSGRPLPQVASLERELRQIDQILRTATAAGESDPKAARLRLILQKPRKTIVFTTAVSTALHLASALRWKRVAVVTGRGARIASGPIPFAEALALFAPRAQGSADPPEILQVDTLIATDLASEGLNLQDAEQVVHYDLPWSPLRLEQRIGRISRLGSQHAAVRSVWFAPHPILERYLALERRIAEKALHQLRSGMPGSSTVGRARISGGLFDWRESLAAAPATTAAEKPLFSVVRGPSGVIAAVRWRLGQAEIPELWALEGTPPRPVLEETAVARIAEQLLAAEAVPLSPPGEAVEGLYSLLKSLAREAGRGPRDRHTRRMARRIMRKARLAASRRDLTMLGVLDRALHAVKCGLPVGALLELEDALDQPRARAQLTALLRRLSGPSEHHTVPVLEAVLVGCPPG